MGNALYSLDEEAGMVCSQEAAPIASPEKITPTVNIQTLRGLMLQYLDSSFCTLLISKILATPFAAILDVPYKLEQSKALVEFKFDLLLDYYIGSIVCERVSLDTTLFRIDGSINNSPLHIVFKQDVVVDPFDNGTFVKQTSDFSLILECSQLYSTIYPTSDVASFWKQHKQLLPQLAMHFAYRMQGKTEFTVMVTAYDFNLYNSHATIRLKQPLPLDLDRFQFTVYKIQVQGRFTKIDLSEDGTHFISHCSTHTEIRVPTTISKSELRAFYQGKLSIDEMQAFLMQGNDIFYRFTILFDTQLNKVHFQVSKN